MLRRKMLLILGSVIVMVVTLAVVALWMLQGVLADLNHINGEATAVVEAVNDLNSQITRAELEMYQMDLDKEHHLDDLVEAVDAMDSTARRLGERYVVHEAGCEPAYQRLMARLPGFARSIGELSVAQDAGLVRRHNLAATSGAAEVRADILEIGTHAHAHARREQLDVTTRFRVMVLVMSVGSLLVINISILALLRVATTILRPVDKLVEASRQLATERFDYRVDVDQHDEFDELGRAFNRLAQQLQLNEERKLETLGQVALTLNHELNNALGVIDLRLRLMERQSGGDPALVKGLRQIHDALQRMAHTVELLKHVRRIVLTDYISGVKMLDLERSAAVEPAERDAGIKG